MTAEDLRKLILQQAIQGKLVPQDPNDEPASKLLERIREEKARLVKEKKIKKDKNESIIYRGEDNSYYEKILATGEVKCIDDEIPFEIPESWEWVRLNELALYRKGPFGSSLTKFMFVPKSETSIKVYEQKNAIQKDFSLGEYYISQEKFKSMTSFIVKPLDIIVSCAGTIGETYVLPSHAPMGIINQALMRISLFDMKICNFYLLYFDYILKKQAQLLSAGSAIKNIPPFEILKNMLMPIPPHNEQEKIIKKIAEFNCLINKYFKAQNQLLDIDRALNGQLKKSILQYAIQGKLVAQDPTDEPASELLKRIEAEKEQLIKDGKIKRDKNASIIFKGDDNKYYENLPAGWTICKLQDIFDIIMGQSPDGDTINSNNGIEFHQGKIYFTNKYLSCSNVYTSRPTKKADINSLLLCVRAPVGVLNITQREICIGRGLCALKPKYDIDIQYWFYVLSCYKDYFESQATGSTFKAISAETIKNTIIPLPPKEEQERILKKIIQINKGIED